MISKRSHENSMQPVEITNENQLPSNDNQTDDHDEANDDETKATDNGSCSVPNKGDGTDKRSFQKTFKGFNSGIKADILKRRIQRQIRLLNIKAHGMSSFTIFNIEYFFRIALK